MEVDECISANRGLMGAWTERSGDGCVSGFAPNWRCKHVVAEHVMSERRRDPPVAGGKSNDDRLMDFIGWNDVILWRTAKCRVKG